MLTLLLYVLFTLLVVALIWRAILAFFPDDPRSRVVAQSILGLVALFFLVSVFFGYVPAGLQVYRVR